MSGLIELAWNPVKTFEEFKEFVDERVKNPDKLIDDIKNFDILKTLNELEQKQLKEGLESIKDCKEGDTHGTDYSKFEGKCHVDESRPCGIIIYSQDGSWEARTIDILTGWYGYDHVAVDIGEVEDDTGKPIMIEATGHTGEVARAFQTEYGTRTGFLIDLAGKIPEDFRDCVKKMLGETYDWRELLTAGLLNDPNKQVCADVARCSSDALFLHGRH